MIYPMRFEKTVLIGASQMCEVAAASEIFWLAPTTPHTVMSACLFFT
jgi:hypothetical protein